MHCLLSLTRRPRTAAHLITATRLLGLLLAALLPAQSTAQSWESRMPALFKQATETARKQAVQRAYADQLIDVSERVDRLSKAVKRGETLRGVDLVMLLNAAEPLDVANLALMDRFAGVAEDLRSGLDAELFLQRHRAVVASHDAAHEALIALLENLKTASELFEPLEPEIEALQEFFHENPVVVPAFTSSETPQWGMEPVRQDVVEMSELAVPLGISQPASIALDPPSPSDLTQTLEIQFTPEIVALASQLNNDPLEMFQWVRNNIEFTPYRGSRRGAAETLRLRAGNDMDQASLLIALLRNSGFHARYHSATVDLDPVAAMNWLGVEDPNMAGSILTTSGMDGVTINDGLGGVAAIRCTRVWVEAFLPYTDYRGAAGAAGDSMWIPLDAAWKTYSNNFGEDVLSSMSFDAESFMDNYVATVRPETILELLEDEITVWLAANEPETSFGEILFERSINPVTLSWLPSSLPYALVSEGSVYGEVPSGERYTIRFYIYGEGSTLDHTLNLVEMAGKQVTISYIGETTADQNVIDANGGILGLPNPYLVYVKPQLRVDGCIVATGTGGTMVGRTQNSQIYFTAPGEAAESISNTILAGNYEGHAIDTGMIEPDIDTSPDLSCPEDYTGYYLHQLGVQYLDRVERDVKTTGQIFGALAFREISNAILGQRVRAMYSGSNTLTFEFKGVGVDADRGILSAFYTDGVGDTSEFLRISGASGSLMENRVFEEELGVEAVSTIKILGVASDQGIPLFKISSSNWSTFGPQLTHPSATVNNVLAAVNSGHVVTIPRDPLTYINWSGTGYIDMTPSTGAAGYIISGGSSGGDTAEEPDEPGCTGATVIGVTPLEPGYTYSECDTRTITIEVQIDSYDPECEVSTSTKEVKFTPSSLGVGPHPFNFGGGGECGGCTPDSVTINIVSGKVTVKDKDGRTASGSLLEVVPQLAGETITCTLENATGNPEWTVSGFVSQTLFGETVSFGASNWLSTAFLLYNIIPQTYNVVTPECPAPTRIDAYSNKEAKATRGAVDFEAILDVLDALDGVAQAAGGPFSLNPDFSGSISFSNQWKEISGSHKVSYTYKFGGEIAGSLSPTFKIGTGLAGFPPVLAEAAVYIKLTGKIGLKGEVELFVSGNLSVFGGATGGVAIGVGGLVSVASGAIEVTIEGTAEITADSGFGAQAKPPEVNAQTKVVAGTLKLGYKVGAIWGLWTTEETYTVFDGFTVYERKDVLLPWN